MKPRNLRFDTPYNCSVSLTLIAELVRRGELVCREGVTITSQQASILNIEIIEPVRPVLDLAAREKRKQLPTA